MKKIIRTMHLVLVAVAMVAIVGCGREENDNSDGWVDLGLPSGLLWAECNVGATAPEEFGDYFAWGETQAKSDYNWTTYLYSRGTFEQLTKYCYDASYGSNGFIDSLTIIVPEDDAATVHLGGGARIPTKEDWEELIENTTIKFSPLNGVACCKFTAANGKSIYLPGAGYRYNTDLCFLGNDGFYWSSTLSNMNPGVAWEYRIGPNTNDVGMTDRSYGRSVRAVRPGR